MDEEIKKLIADYVRQIEDREDELVALKQNIDKIIHDGEVSMTGVSADLDKKLDAGKISEDEYLEIYRKQKNEITQKTKEKLDALIKEVKITNS